MKLKALQMFIKLIETGSYSRVAEKLDLTQPAVSMQIKALEEYFETKLVQKEKGEISLTPSGKIIYNNAIKIMEIWEETIFNINQVKNKTYGSLKIGCSTIPSEYLLPKVLAKYSTQFPQIKTNVEVGDSKDIIEKLKAREVDLIIVGFNPRVNKFHSKAIADDTLELIVPFNHHLTTYEEISVHKLTQENILIREKGSGTRKAMLEGLKNAGIKSNQLNICCQLGSTEAIISAVEAGLGISFISKLAAKKAVNYKRVKTINVSDMLINRKFYLACHKERANEVIINKFFDLFPIN